MGAVHVAAVFKMFKQTAEIQVDGPDGGHHIIRHTLLGMQESGCILKNPDTVVHQAGIIGTGHGIHGLFIRNPRKYQPHVNSSACRQSHGPCQFIRNHQIRCRKPYIVLGPVQNMHADIFTHMLFRQRGIAVRLNKAVFSGRRKGRVSKIRFKYPLVEGSPVDGRPHLQKQHGQRPDRFSLEADSAVFPLAIGMHDVKIFVCQIVAAGKADLPVNHCDFPVVSVVHEYVQQRHQTVEYPHLYAIGSHPADKIRADKTDGSHIVIKDTDFHAFCRFLFQNMQNAAEGLRFLDCVIFQENKALCLPHGLLLRAQRFPCVSIIGHFRISVNRKAAGLLQIPGNIRRRTAVPSHLFQHLRILLNHREQNSVNF